MNLCDAGYQLVHKRFESDCIAIRFNKEVKYREIFKLYCSPEYAESTYPGFATFE